MSFQKLLIASLLAVGLSLLVIKLASGRGGEQTPDLSSLSDADLRTLTIRLERTGCYGTCPAYAVAIHGDGRIEYTGKSHVKETGTSEGRMALEEIRALVSEFAKIKFWGITEDYSQAKCVGRVCTDMATAVTEIRIKGVTHRVRH
jgi:Domain of unknown function (DUF6438)